MKRSAVLCYLVVSVAEIVFGCTNVQNVALLSTFKCRRYSLSTCNGQGSCNSVTDQCQCFQTSDYDCGVNLATNAVSSSCSPTCQNGGTCYSPTNGVDPPFCKCPPQWKGPDCSNCRADVQCSQDNMVVTLYPASQPFVGELQILQPGTTNVVSICQYNTSSSEYIREQDNERFVVQLDTNTAQTNPGCFGGFYQNGLDKCYIVLLKYKTNIITGSEEYFSFCCNTNRIATVTATLSSVTAQLPTDIVQVSQAGIAAYAEFRNTDHNTATTGSLITTATVGQRISLVVGLTPDAAAIYDHFRVTDCSASSVQLIANRCPAPNRDDVVSQVRLFNNELFVDIFAFKPTSSNILTVTCTVLGCNAVDPSCIPLLQCGTFRGVSYGRKKRQANETTGVDIPGAKASLVVLLDNQITCPARNQNVQEPGCSMYDVFIPVVVVFCVLLLIAVCIVVYLCTKITKKRPAFSSTRSDFPSSASVVTSTTKT